MQQFVSRRRESFIGMVLSAGSTVLLAGLFLHLLAASGSHVTLAMTVFMFAAMAYATIDFAIRFARPTRIGLEERGLVVETPFGTRYFERGRIVRVAGIGSLLLFVKQPDGTEMALSIGHWPKELRPALEAYAAKG